MWGCGGGEGEVKEEEEEEEEEKGKDEKGWWSGGGGTDGGCGTWFASRAAATLIVESTQVKSTGRECCVGTRHKSGVEQICVHSNIEESRCKGDGRDHHLPNVWEERESE